MKKIEQRGQTGYIIDLTAEGVLLVITRVVGNYWIHTTVACLYQQNTT